MKAGRKKIPITGEQSNFIRENYSSMTVMEICKELGLSNTLVNQEVRRLGFTFEEKRKRTFELDLENGVWSDKVHRELFRI